MPVKREHSSEIDELKSDAESNSSLVDIKPNIKKSKKSSATSRKPKPETSPSSSKKSKAENPGKKMGSWSGEELKLLYSIMCPKRTGVNWNEVASQIEGRDAKACNNKWSRIQTKFMQAIENLGE
ncbi:uncharacterized protein L201_000648 [Kwoniella dendrophila CBS 6074]|uniref:Myb-like domain-containing protein n=1 Tax=Kwoniella dendrophila CBS 6074 TaxID=1295534 RepID=A0AAX4JLW3_9TREE